LSLSPTTMTQPHLRIAFLGPAGTFTHAAARGLFGSSAEYVDVSTIDGVFETVRRNAVSYGVVPIENSTEGSVTNTVDALVDGDDIVICREVRLEIRQCLISKATNLSDLERVYSHPQALAQCRAWLAANVPNAQCIQAASTATAVRQASDDTCSAAIASELAAELYEVPVLRVAIQDVADNATRFAVLATVDSPRTGRDKTTIAFAVHDGRGALLRVLEVFDSHDINLTRIESRPSRRKAWDYVFLADLDGHRDDANVKTALAILRDRCPMLRLLGSYPKSGSALASAASIR
jgi:chorismate mutase/prephenate dehydratase